MGEGAEEAELWVPVLVRRGHWTADVVRDGIVRALARGQPPYRARWFRGLAARVLLPKGPA
ncbi:hypothetical protein [Geodermatophilus sp. SYSU D01176]